MNTEKRDRMLELVHKNEMGNLTELKGSAHNIALNFRHEPFETEEIVEFIIYYVKEELHKDRCPLSDFILTVKEAQNRGWCEICKEYQECKNKKTTGGKK